MSCATSEQAPNCCACCPCPTPKNLTATFTQVAGNPCSNLDGFTIDFSQLDDGDCPQEWSAGPKRLPNGEDVEMELKCDSATSWDLSDLQRIWENEGSLGTPDVLISAQCNPLKLVFELVVHHEFACADTDNENGPYTFHITIEEASP
ncbi:MAG: hypothetical protein H8E66_33895 [Planctomycetes bacterium]|nr:hypothetical protein [Planctomycetota bacterium]